MWLMLKNKESVPSGKWFLMFTIIRGLIAPFFICQNKMRFFRWTEKQVALLPESLEIKWGKRKTIRQSIWKQIYELVRIGEIDKDEFEPWSLHEMQHWRAPRVKDTQTTGSDIADQKYHIHHKQPRWRWWRDKKENLVITTPKYHHQGTLDPATHYWK